MRVKLIVAYDGTNYCGWQIQPNAVTVESVIRDVLQGFTLLEWMTMETFIWAE